MLLDTHVLFWWLADPSRLSPEAARWTDPVARQGRVVLIPTVSLWELEQKRQSGKLPFSTPLRAAWPQLKRLPGVRWVDADAEDWMSAAELPWTHQDPADRLIAAIALNRHVPVLTKDAVFHATGCPVKAVW